MFRLRNVPLSDDECRCVCFGPSMTAPNEAFSVAELMKRAMAGMPVPAVARELEFGEDEDFDAVQPPTDLLEYFEQAEQLNALERQLAELMKQKKMQSEKTDEETFSDKEVLPDSLQTPA